MPDDGEIFFARESIPEGLFPMPGSDPAPQTAAM